MRFELVTKKAFEWRALNEAARQAVRDATVATAFAIKARAIPEIPVDTGFAKNSLYIKFPDGSEYEEAVALASAALSIAGKDGRRLMLPETTEPAIETGTDYSVVLAGGAEYLFWLHEGTHGNAGIPFFSQSAEDERDPYFRRLARALNENFSHV